MKTLTITISDEAAQGLQKAVEGGRHTVEQVAAHVIEDAYGGDDILAGLDPEERAAIQEGLAELDRGEFASQEQIDDAYAQFRK